MNSYQLLDSANEAQRETIKTLRSQLAAKDAEIAELRAALEPFSARTSSENYINSADVPDHGLCAGQSYTAGDYRRARAAIRNRTA